MVSYATMAYLIIICVVMFLYTILWDFYVAFWTLAGSIGANSTILNYLYLVHQWIPVAFFLSATFWYLVQAQRRVPQ